MAEKITLSDLNKTLTEMNVQSLEGLTIEGDVEIEIDAGAGGVGPLFAYYFGQEAAKIAMQLMNFAKAVGYPVENLLQPVASSAGSYLQRHRIWQLLLRQSRPSRWQVLWPAPNSASA